MTQDRVSIEVKGVSKIYSLYEKPADRLKEAMSIGHKPRHKNYNALKDITFQVHQGETFGIIGTNGAGKSTLLKIITGVASPSGGQVKVEGKIAALLELGAGFNTEYTGLENIYLNGTMMGYTREEMEKRVNGILEFADIGEFIHQPVKTYSSGMFARLAFAVAINVEPDVLIVDEALSVGDVFFQNKCYRKFEELRAKNTTVLFVSHDIGSVRQMCSRVLWIENGVQQMVGGAKEVCDAYSNARILEANEYFKKELKPEGEEKEIGEQDNVKPGPILPTDSAPRIREDADGTFSDDAEILSVFVTDSNNEIVEELYVDHYYSICIVSRFHKDLSGVIFGFTMENIKGIKILGENTFAKKKIIFKARQGETCYTSFSFKLPRLETGNYLISPAIAVGTQLTPVILTWINSACRVKVEREGYNLAMVDLDYELKIQKVDEIHLY